MDFVAIDFETANQRPNSACQVAVVVVRDSQIIDQRVWLVRPPSDYFAPINISVHGIRPSDVEKSPTMEQVWHEMSGWIDGQTMIAHNARFDMGVLVASLSAYELACPNFDFQCTRVLAQASWPGRMRYGLKPLGSWLGIQFRHHDALEDARCCAQIALAAESAAGSVGALATLEARLNIQRGYYRNQRLTSPRMPPRSGKANAGRKSSLDRSGNSPKWQSGDRQYADRWGFPLNTGQRPAGSVDVDLIREACVDLPLAGKNIVMLGPLRGLSMEETKSLLMELGATLQSTINSMTDLVVAGGMSLADARGLLPDTLGGGPLPVVVHAAVPEESNPKRSAEKKQGIRVLSERQFRAMLPGGSGTT